jgi:hypothetical protein
MISLLFAAAVATSAPAPAPLGKTAWVFATVGNSEWCPAGNVRLDLVKGTYALTPRASRRVCQDKDLDRRLVNGKLDKADLATVREAYARAVAEGLEDPTCRRDKDTYVVIYNGGPRLLVVATGRATRGASSDINCWSPAADALYDTLNDVFRLFHDTDALSGR